MKKYAIIVAGGSGSRMGEGLPKQFRPLMGKPMLWWSMKAFHDESSETELILVLPQDYISLWGELMENLPEDERFPHKITPGGETRTESVRKGLAFIEDADSLVAIHDGARPLVTEKIIVEGWRAGKLAGAGIPAVRIADSLRKILYDGDSRVVDRSRFRAIQTPQVFQSSLIISAYEKSEGKTFTDDASMVEETGVKIALFQGDTENFKVTTPIDLTLAEIVIANRNKK